MTRLEDLGRRFGVPVDGLAAVLELQATDPAASTTVRDVRAAVDRHVADSLVAVELLRDAGAIADVGSGAGWPGLALAAALPDTRVYVVESAARHCRYLARAVEAGGFANVEVVHARVEEWSGAVDVVTARALASLPVLVEYAAPLLVEGGRLVAWKGAPSAEEVAAGAAAASIVGLSEGEVMEVSPYPAAERRSLHVFRKVAATPERFPRRPGMAVKRPLA